MNVSSPRRYLSVWLRRLATDRILRGRAAAPADLPLAIVGEIKNAHRLTALNDAAAALGLKVGTALADARAMYPGLAVEAADPAADRLLLGAIADWCDRFTPLVGLDPPDGIILDVTGCAHLFGGESDLCRDLMRRLAIQGFRSRVAVADTVGCASAVARYGTPAAVPSGGVREILLPLPLAALRIASDLVALLAEAGLRKIADVIALPRAPLAARFGAEFVRRLDQAFGREDEPITPRLPVPAYMAERRFADPIALEADVLGIIEHLGGELSRLLQARGEGARRLQVALFRADGKVHRIEVGTGEPVRDAARVRRLFAERLAAVGDACDPGFGFDVIRLSALATERLDPVQTGLARDSGEAELSHLVDRLSARFGERRVQRLIPQNTHIPELAVAAVPAQAKSARFESYAVEQDSLGPVRPIRLFEWPEAIEAIAAVPDGPPVRFRWRRVLHEVTAAEGPERIAMEWWRDDKGNALTRDYFRVESREGVRVWLYREGLYGREETQPRWFLHGLFA
ncbi:MAG TPA: DNA polymerase Y family protein [Xanthobacteraceae bacterium]|nr:DNA polymerase Y family protein [Xanthobacteraceae bacterium]